MATIKSRVPFFENTEDDLHCSQAVLRMILKYFEPQRDYSWEELDTITGFVLGKWTWATQALLWLKRRGYEIKSVDVFDYQRFVDVGSTYVLEFLGAEAGSKQIAMGDIEKERALARQYLEEIGAPLRREATLQDLRQMRRDGFLTSTNINSNALNGQPGYNGHYVLLLDVDLKTVRLHDPGLPALPNRKVKIADFEKAWAYPDSKAKSLTGVRLGEPSVF
jgi:hypothetical protein